MSKSSFITEIKEKADSKKKLLDLQRQFEDGKITEEEMTDFEKVELEKLYNEQIEELNNMILAKKKEIKQKIKRINMYYKNKNLAGNKE